MTFRSRLLLAAALGAAALVPAAFAQETSNAVPPTVTVAPVLVTLETTAGSIVLELDANAAPATVANFVQYVKEGFYDGTIFHRVIPSFMIQGGGYDKGLARKSTHAPIAAESRNGLHNVRGSIAMARTSDPNSATAQFFINVVDNAMLDYPSRDGTGYTVFGHVVSGMEAVDRIRDLPTVARSPEFANLPENLPVIVHARLGK